MRCSTDRRASFRDPAVESSTCFPTAAGMTAAKQIEFYQRGLCFELSAASTAGQVTGSHAARTALAAANSNTSSKSTALGKGSNNNPTRAGKPIRGGRRGFASASVALSESVMSAPQAPVSAKVRFSTCCVCILVAVFLLSPPGFPGCLARFAVFFLSPLEFASSVLLSCAVGGNATWLPSVCQHPISFPCPWHSVRMLP